MPPRQRSVAWLVAVGFAGWLAALAGAATAADDSAPPPAAASGMSAEALANYEEGKRRYDAGDFEAALRAFTQAARIDPGNARWHYNIGLALRQLDHFQAARDAFLAARRRDPEYKHAEIDAKLSAMGFDTSGTATRSNVSRDADDGIPVAAIAGGTLVVLALGVAIVVRRRKSRRPANPPADVAALEAADPVALDAQSARLMRLGATLVAAEHALRLGEDHDLRALLDRATELESAARRQLDAAGAGSGRDLAKATRTLDDAEALAGDVQARVKALDPNPGAHGERIGCYFCARPLANPDYRRLVPLRSRAGNADVLACPVCAGRVVHGETPATTVIDGEGGPRHWSEDPAFDPYLRRHAPDPAATQLPAWRHAPGRPLADLALLAAGGALGAGAAYAATRAFDLDAARESGLAQEAARVTTERAGREGRDSRLRDAS